MRYYSTNDKKNCVGLKQAVTEGLAPDNGLYMPERIERLSPEFFAGISGMSLQELSFEVARAFFGEDIPYGDLEDIVYDTMNFDIPVVGITGNINALELFHGPTAAFKDIGARFMARTLSYFISSSGTGKKVTVLVATSGDTGSAVANGFLNVPGIEVVVLYPAGLVSEIQEKQFTTLGGNITALEVQGTFDDCQRLVKTAFLDADLKQQLVLTSANSINVARFIPQSFYYFHAYARMKAVGKFEDLVFCVPSGNFGNLTAGLFAKRMGLPVKRFIAANNRNDIFLEYLQSGQYNPRRSVQTVANAMDVGDPSNFVRILDLYGHDVDKIRKDISGYSYGDQHIMATITRVLKDHDYLLDPHGACGYLALEDGLEPGENGVFLETAHPAKFIATVENATGIKVDIPQRLNEFMDKPKLTVPMGSDFSEFKEYMLYR